MVLAPVRSLIALAVLQLFVLMCLWLKPSQWQQERGYFGNAHLGEFEHGCRVPQGMRRSTVNVLNMTMDMFTSEGNDLMSADITKHGFWELQHPQELAALADGVIPEGGVFLDIGANIGYYSMLFAKFGYDVIAIEPMPQNVAAIIASLCLNPDIIPRITLIHSALVSPEESTQTCVVKVHGHNRRNGVLSCHHFRDGIFSHGRFPSSLTCDCYSCHCEEVPVTTLDALLAKLNPSKVTVAKMDVEGFECNVFKGGESLMTRYRPQFMQVELLSKHVQVCFNSIAARFGYRVGGHKGHDGNTVMAAIPYAT